MKRRGWAASDTTAEVGELHSRRSAVRRRGTLSVELTADDIMSLAVNVVQNGWSQEECRPHTGDVEITLPDTVLHDIHAAMLMASRRAAAKRMGRERAPRLRLPVGRVVAADSRHRPGNSAHRLDAEGPTDEGSPRWRPAKLAPRLW